MILIFYIERLRCAFIFFRLDDISFMYAFYISPHYLKRTLQ